MSKIGVFDSGIGGEAVAAAIRRELPDDEVITVSDRTHVPYGDKPPVEVLGYVVPLLEGLVGQGCEVIVVACNTVTTQHIVALRERIPVPLVGIEPMVKPAAAATKSGVIAVCATPGTLASERYAWLKREFAQVVTVLEPDCGRWAYMVEHNEVNEAEIKREVDEMCNAGADVIVLGCTHYHWIEELLMQLAAERAVVIQPEQPVVARLKHVLGASRALKDSSDFVAE
jgi:glutamate racemase